MRRKIFNLFLVLSFTLIFAMTIWAAVPPPPVNQKIGFFETRFNNLTAPECRACHNQNPPDGIPVNPTYLPDRHHLLIGTPVPTPTVVPNRDVDGDGLNDTTFKCLNCHSMVWDGSAWVMDQNFRDCMICHKQLYGDHHGWSPHHATPLAQADKNNDGIQDTNANGEPVTYCSECHGSLVTDLGDGHYIPTYVPSLITPWRSEKPNGDSSTVNSRGTQAGNCNFCHDSGTHTDTREIVNNLLSHHGAGFFGGYSGTGPCFWCHNINPVDNWPIKDAYSIRVCEGCHGVQSLHNIQADSNGDDIIEPGVENPCYGHIGSNDDCWGCHGFSTQTANASYSGPTVPYITDLSQMVVNAGQGTILTIRGVAFTNNVQGPDGPITLTSNVILEAVDGTITTLTPDNITQSAMDVTIPFWVNLGRYNLKARKASQLSNRTVFLVKPWTTINSATCNNNGIVTINGSGFSEYVNAVNSGTSVQLLGGSTCSVNSWSDTEIVANCGTCSGTAEVNSVFGTASKAIVDLTPKPCNYEYSAWSACRPDNTQSRTYTKSPDGCIENPPPVTTQTCTYIPPTCTEFTYSGWSACVNGQQTRTVISSSPAGCVGGNPVLTQTCNQPPVANAGPDQSARTNRSVKFDGSASKDPDGYITKYQWNFGDGTSGSGKVVYHKYTIRKTYTVTLKVTDNKGTTATDTASVRIY